jgi:hypothetical protein
MAATVRHRFPPYLSPFSFPPYTTRSRLSRRSEGQKISPIPHILTFISPPGKDQYYAIFHSSSVSQAPPCSCSTCFLLIGLLCTVRPASTVRGISRALIRSPQKRGLHLSCHPLFVALPTRGEKCVENDVPAREGVGACSTVL